MATGTMSRRWRGIATPSADAATDVGRPNRFPYAVPDDRMTCVHPVRTDRGIRYCRRRRRAERAIRTRAASPSSTARSVPLRRRRFDNFESMIKSPAACAAAARAQPRGTPSRAAGSPRTAARGAGAHPHLRRRRRSPPAAARTAARASALPSPPRCTASHSSKPVLARKNSCAALKPAGGPCRHGRSPRFTTHAKP